MPRNKNDYLLCYHGTTRDRADIILKEGFKPDCWFAKHLEDAFVFGGNIILVVSFLKSLMPRGWQFHVLDSIPPERIIRILEVKELNHD